MSPECSTPRGESNQPRALQTAIDFNNTHADEEMPFFNQDIFDFAESITLNPTYCDPRFTSAVLPTTATCMTYNDALKIGHLDGANGVEAAMSQFNLDAVVAPTDNPAWATDLLYGDHFLFGSSTLAAPPGYPIVQVPAAIVFGLPMGISFFGTTFSEPTLIRLASGFEAAAQVRAKNLPTFAPMTPYNNIQGTPLTKPSPKSAAAPWTSGAQKKLSHHM